MPNVSPQRYTIAFNIRVDQEFVDMVDELRALYKPIPSKADAVRTAVLQALRTRQTELGVDRPSPVPRSHLRKRIDPIKAAADGAEALSATKKQRVS
jgi:hypothetical protein